MEHMMIIFSEEQLKANAFFMKEFVPWLRDMPSTELEFTLARATKALGVKMPLTMAHLAAYIVKCEDTECLDRLVKLYIEFKPTLGNIKKMKVKRA
jgi:hypothetical protein